MEPSSSQPLQSHNREEEPTHTPTPTPTPTANSIANHSNLVLSILPSNDLCSNPNPSENEGRLIKRSKKALKAIPSFSAASSSSSISLQKGLRISGKRRNPKVVNRFRGDSDFDALALPLGMSIAAVVAQVLDRKDIANERISADHLSLICSSAVKESLANVFGHRLDCFVRNFEKSFGSTLRTLRLINEASMNNAEDYLSQSTIESCGSKVSQLADEHVHPSGISEMKTRSEEISATSDISEMKTRSEEISATSGIYRPLPCMEDMQENARLDDRNREIALHGQINQQIACSIPSTLGSRINNSVLSTFEKSVMEQSRSNDLKTFEIGLMMKRLQLEESQLSLKAASNSLERFKILFGISKESFKEEKFKNQVEETRHAELLRKCVDCLVAGLVIMSSSLVYGAYIYSYQRISELTTSCMTPPKESTSWWIPKPVSSFNSGMHMLRCQAVVVSRMLFGVIMILAIAYLLLQRSSSSNQTMPVTFILLLLGVLCGFSGKLCVDTLGGSGYNWLLYWETLVLLHFFANLCTSTLFSILHGPVSVSQGVEAKAILPYWSRRFAFYSIMLFWLPLFCGLIPFAGFSDWKDHFYSLAADAVAGSITVEEL